MKSTPEIQGDFSVYSPWTKDVYQPTIVLALLPPDEHGELMLRADDCGQRQSCVWDPTDRVKLQLLLFDSLVNEIRDLHEKYG